MTKSGQKAPRNEMEERAVALAQYEDRIGEMDVWSERYEREHAAWMRQRFAFKSRFGIADTEVFNATPNGRAEMPRPSEGQ